LSGASETVRQSTLSKLGSFSASLRLDLSALKLASKAAASPTLSSTRSSRFPSYSPSTMYGLSRASTM